MPKDQKAAAFDAHAFFEAMGRGRTVSKYQPQDVVFHQGDRADSVYYVQSGKVKLSVTSASGKEAVIAVLGDGDFFGEGSLISQPVRLATATALAECTLDRIDKSKMLRVLHDEAQFSDRFTAHLLTRNSRVEADLVDQLMNSSEKRLARSSSCLRTSARKAGLSRSQQKSVKRRSQKWSGQHDPGSASS
jgi:CRP-like cAMP-binding protein